MTEDYLQFLWKHKRILKPNICLTDSRELKILNFGNHNTLLKGPDFKQGSIFLDGLTFHGHIEIHVQSSDWYLHGHHLDSNYNNVILHVVYLHDKEVYQNGVKLPVLELKDLIDEEHWIKHKKYMSNSKSIICENEISTIDLVFLESMMNKSLVNKINEKVELIKSYISPESSPFFVFLAAAFGSNINKYAFLELIRKVPHHQMSNLNVSQRYKLLMSESGMLTSKREEGIKADQWHFKGTRPRNFPIVRIKQFAQLIGDSELEMLVEISTATEMIELLNRIFDRCNDQMSNGDSNLSRDFKNNLIINGVVPYFWYLSEVKCDESYQEMAFSLLLEIAPENNSILKKWKKSNVQVRNAYDSQGLLGLYRYYCCRKKCLSCEVGNKILNN